MNNVLVGRSYVNPNVCGVILSNKEMLALGFANYTGNEWSFCKLVADNITLNVTISVDGGDIEIVTFDEDTLLPFDYEYFMNHESSCRFAESVKQEAIKWMQHLVSSGVLIGWNESMLI